MTQIKLTRKQNQKSRQAERSIARSLKSMRNNGVKHRYSEYSHNTAVLSAFLVA